MDEKIKSLKSLVSEKRNIVITMHSGPDGDAMGSALGLYNIFLQQGHNVVVITPNDYASFLHWMPGNSNVIVFTEQEEKAIEITKNADLIFFLDFSHIKRLNDYASVVEQNSIATKIMIDHHQDPDESIADIIFSDVSSCSTSQIIFEIIDTLGLKNLINIDVAECLYTGIMTDTGSFKYSSTTEKTHYIIAQLIGMGAKNSKIHDFVYDNFSEDRVKLLGYCLNQKLLIFKESCSAIISLTTKELKRFNFKKGDTEGIVNYALTIEDVMLSVFIVEKNDKVKLSFRSKGNFKVNKIAKKYFKGGGHMNAAGGIADLSVNETIEKLKEIFKENKTKLLNIKL